MKESIIINGKHRVLVLSDIHLPYHDPVALGNAIQFGKTYHPDIVVLLGDVIDCVSISRFVKKVDERDLNKEVQITREFLYKLRKTFPLAKIFYLEGNHEERQGIYLLAHAEALAGLKELTLPSLLHLDKLKITYLTKETTIRIGKMTFTHGQVIKGSCSQFPARSLFLSAKTNAMCGHCHRESTYTCRSLTGEVFKTFSVGCLSDISPGYSVFNDFVAGFATMETDGNGEFQVTLRSCV